VNYGRKYQLDLVASSSCSHSSIHLLKQTKSNITAMVALKALNQSVQCHCGKVKLAIVSPDVLRFVCYCKDCRGYYNTLNDHCCQAKKSTTAEKAAPLDFWGGVDYTQVYPSEITIVSGKEHISTSVIRKGSKINRFYTSCCYTPLFSIGSSGAALLNSHLIPDDSNKPEVRFRIIDRNSLLNKDHVADRPSMSWSVPLAWIWTMPGRIRKERVTPMPLEVPENVSVLDGFKEG